jgi:TRAP-type uncharacterized transport system fused permease subunit
MLARASVVERVMLVAAGLLLMYSSPLADAAGLALAAVAVAAQLWKRRRASARRS